MSNEHCSSGFIEIHSLKRYNHRMSFEKSGENTLLETLKVDRDAVSVTSLGDESEDNAYWFSRTPEERLLYMEMLRRINYGDSATARLQRVLEVVEREQR